VKGHALGLLQSGNYGQQVVGTRVSLGAERAHQALGSFAWVERVWRASPNVPNNVSFQHSSLSLRLKLSMKPFCWGFPGAI